MVGGGNGIKKSSTGLCNGPPEGSQSKFTNLNRIPRHTAWRKDRCQSRPWYSPGAQPAVECRHSHTGRDKGLLLLDVPAWAQGQSRLSSLAPSRRAVQFRYTTVTASLSDFNTNLLPSENACSACPEQLLPPR